MSRNLTSVLSPKQVRRLVRIAFNTVLFGLSFLMIQLIFRIFIYDAKIIQIIIMFGQEIQSITIAMVIVYMVFFYLLCLNVLNLLNLVRKHLLKNGIQSKLMFVHDILREIEYNINEFDSIFSVIPFFSLTFIFVSATYLVIGLRKGISIIGSIDFIIDHVISILFILFIANKRKCLKEKTEEINEIILKQQDMSQEVIKTYILLKIEKQLDFISKLNVTAWSVFTLDMSLLLSYISCVLTFTVMFVGFVDVQ